MCSLLFPAPSKEAVRAVQAMNRICVLDVDLQGVRSIKKTDLRPIYIFVQPPSLDVLVGTWRGKPAGQALGPAEYLPNRDLHFRSSDCDCATLRLKRVWQSGWQLHGQTWRAVSAVRPFMPSEHVARPFTRSWGGPRVKMEGWRPLSAEPLRVHTSLLT